jgi:hypothetical protein
MRPLVSILVCLAAVCPAPAQDGHTARVSSAGLEMNQQVVATFDQAWQSCKNGNERKEKVILIYRMAGGFVRARLMPETNEFQEAKFKWDPAARAIVHTHPNAMDAEPSYQDMQLADRLRVPIYTITNRGMFMYDPRVKQTCKVRDGLDWLRPTGWSLQSCLASLR